MTSHRHTAGATALFFLFAGFASGKVAAQDARYDLGGGFLGGAGLEASAIYRDNYFYERDGGVSAYGMRLRPQVGVGRSSTLGLSGPHPLRPAG